ncbi:hypothetical protein GCM10022240_30090 [Microbacterium kribbense]|uniref:Uncharacterized protein n=1 Tax=Microbacterium kribbense TaxID=433645 RepID=A0ABP7GXI5_9MICO
MSQFRYRCAERRLRAAAERAAAEVTQAKSRQRSRAWAAAHPEDVAERGRRWERQHRERRREISREYYVRNKEVIAARAKERRRLEPEGQAKWTRAYRDAHREEIAHKQHEKRKDPDVKRWHAEYDREWDRREGTCATYRSESTPMPSSPTVRMTQLGSTFELLLPTIGVSGIVSGSPGVGVGSARPLSNSLPLQLDLVGRSFLRCDEGQPAFSVRSLLQR